MEAEDSLWRPLKETAERKRRWSYRKVVDWIDFSTLQMENFKQPSTWLKKQNTIISLCFTNITHFHQTVQVTFVLL